MSGLTFTPLGVGDAFTAKYYSVSTVIEAEGATLLVDCPHPIRKMMAESEIDIDVPDLTGVILTHLHGDHVSGLEGLAFFNHFVCKRALPLLAHPEVVAPLWHRHLEASMSCLIHPTDHHPMPEKGFADYFDHTPLSLTSSVQFGPFTIECRRTIHHIFTTALRITAGGRTLGMSADTAFDPGLLEWLSAADVIIHETNYGAHTPYERLAELPADLRAKMRLHHYPDDFDVSASVIEPLVQGRRYSA
ncbi:MAG: MBL fold metallo-hydrolase [Bradymonadia bacterium]